MNENGNIKNFEEEPNFWTWLYFKGVVILEIVIEWLAKGVASISQSFRSLLSGLWNESDDNSPEDESQKASRHPSQEPQVQLCEMAISPSNIIVLGGDLDNHDDKVWDDEKRDFDPSAPVLPNLKSEKLFVISKSMLPFLKLLGIEKGIGINITRAEIKAGFKAKCLQVHPDKGREVNPAAFIEVKNAFEQLEKMLEQDHEDISLDDDLSDFLYVFKTMVKIYEKLQIIVKKLEKSHEEFLVFKASVEPIYKQHELMIEQWDIILDEANRQIYQQKVFNARSNLQSLVTCIHFAKDTRLFSEMAVQEVQQKMRSQYDRAFEQELNHKIKKISLDIQTHSASLDEELICVSGLEHDLRDFETKLEALVLKINERDEEMECLEINFNLLSKHIEEFKTIIPSYHQKIDTLRSEIEVSRSKLECLNHYQREYSLKANTNASSNSQALHNVFFSFFNDAKDTRNLAEKAKFGVNSL